MPDDVSLARVRLAIDGLDGALLLVLATRARLARQAKRFKRAAGLPVRDPAREAQVHARAEAMARRIGLSATTARQAMSLAINHAHREQGIAPDVGQGDPPGDARIMAADMQTSTRSIPHASRSLLRLLPPPARVAPLLRVCPPPLQRRLLQRVLTRVLSAPVADGTLDFMRGRRLGIDVCDLDLHWVIEGTDGGLRVGEAMPEASVRGTAADLLLLASRLEDADTLFFQRRLVLTGDTELGLTARNLLERLPWESVPLGLRILLNRGARLARDARSAYHQQPQDAAVR